MCVVLQDLQALQQREVCLCHRLSCDECRRFGLSFGPMSFNEAPRVIGCRRVCRTLAGFGVPRLAN